MPKVKPLTEAQRIERVYQERLKWMADGLAVYKNRRRMTNAEVAASLGIGVSTVRNVLDEKEVALKTKDMLRLMFACGLSVTKKQEASNEVP